MPSGPNPAMPAITRRAAAAGVAVATLPLSPAQSEEPPPMTRDVEYARPSAMHPTAGYSHYAKVRSGQVVYVAGQVALDASGQLVGKGDFRAQVEQVFQNLDTVLKAAGGSVRDVVKMTYFCAEAVPASEITAVRDIRGRHLNMEAPPASTFVFVSRLVNPDWLIEIEAVAVVGG